MSGFRSICTNECTLVIASKYFSFVFVTFNCTVEEDYRDICCFCFFNDLRRSVYRTRCYDVNDQYVCTCLDSCIDLLVLCCLVVVCIVVLIFNTQFVQFSIQCCTYGSDVCIAVCIVHNCYVCVRQVNIACCICYGLCF